MPVTPCGRSPSPGQPCRSPPRGRRADRRRRNGAPRGDPPVRRSDRRPCGRPPHHARVQRAPGRCPGRRGRVGAHDTALGRGPPPRRHRVRGVRCVLRAVSRDDRAPAGQSRRSSGLRSCGPDGVTPGDHGRCSDRRVRHGARRPCRKRVGERPDLHRGGRLHRDLAAPALPPRPRGEGVRAARHRPRVHPSLREPHDPHARDRTVGVESGGRPDDRARTRPPCSRRGVGRSGGRALRSAPRCRRGAGGRLRGEVAATSRGARRVPGRW